VLVPDDEVVFHVFAAPDRSIVEEVSRAADLRHERIVESVAVERSGARGEAEVLNALIGSTAPARPT
jgi:hypothetical protein